MNTMTQDTQTTTTEKSWRGIFFRGPRTVKTYDNKQAINWSVYQGDNQGRPRGRVYESTDFDRAGKLAESMAADRGIELINEAAPLAA